MAKRTKEGAAREKARKAAANRAKARRADLDGVSAVTISTGSGADHKSVTLTGKAFGSMSTPELADAFEPVIGDTVRRAMGVGEEESRAGDRHTTQENTGGGRRATQGAADEIVLEVSTAIGRICGSDGPLGSVWILRDRHDEGGCLLIATNGNAAAVAPATMVGPRVLPSPDALSESVGALREVLPDMLPRSMAKPDGQQPRQLRCVRGPEGTLFGREPVWSDQEERRWAPMPPSQTMPPMASVFPLPTVLTVHVEVNVGLLEALARAVNTPGAGDKVILSVTPGAAAVGVLGDVGAGVMLCEQPDWKHEMPRWRALMQRIGKRGV